MLQDCGENEIIHVKGLRDVEIFSKILCPFPSLSSLILVSRRGRKNKILSLLYREGN